MSRPDAERYDAEFYADQVDGSARSAAVVLPIILGIVKVGSVIDVGCGQGAWLAAAGSLGVRTLTGLDGDWVDRAKLRSPRITFHATDLAAAIPDHGRHDLCISVEVAEHLPAARAESFVAELCRASEVVLFSAAAPQQGGTAHLNEERATRWIARFATLGYDCFDLVRGAVWDDPRVAWWYRQNLFLFVARASALHATFGAAPRPVAPRDVVHPDAFEAKVAWLEEERRRLRGWIEHPTIGQALRGVARALRDAFTGGKR